MTCHHVLVPGGGAAIVCGPSRKCRCGKRATLLCDWKVPGKRSGTCDHPLCAGCSSNPDEGKDLCPAQAGDFDRWRQDRAAMRGATIIGVHGAEQ